MALVYKSAMFLPYSNGKKFQVMYCESDGDMPSVMYSASEFVSPSSSVFSGMEYGGPRSIMDAFTFDNSTIRFVPIANNKGGYLYDNNTRLYTWGNGSTSAGFYVTCIIRNLSDGSIYWGTIDINLNASSTPADYSLVLPTADTAGFGTISTPPPYTIWYLSGKITNQKIVDLINSHLPSGDDPFGPGGETEPGGGDGPFGPNGEDITDPEVPDVDAVSTGFITLFNPSVSELNSLASYMWSGGFDLNTFKKLFANPMDCILGLSILPKIVPNGGRGNVLVGNIDTGVSMTKAAKQYIKFDCGSINIERYSNSFLDYSPYTKIYLYLPFIGIHEISTDDVMNKTLQVKYSIDILSGACVAFVIAGGTTLYSYIGQCAASVPVTSQDWSTMINGVLGAVGSIASTVGAIASGDIGGAIRGAASTAQSVLSSKPDVQHSGSMGGMGGMLGIKTPFVIIERPSQAIPKRQNEYTGYPSFVTMDFEDLTGYNEIYSTHLHNIPCTENELKEIESLLKSGVIF